MRIFISYSSKNRTLVEALTADLEAVGHEVWFDKELSGGQNWWSTILDAIRNCDLFIFALTPLSLDSYPCRLEYTYAHDLHKRVLPVLLETVNTSLLPQILSVLQFVDYRTQDKAALQRLTRAIGLLPAAQPLPDPLPAEPAVPLSPMGKLNERINSDGPMDVNEQKAILFDLRELLANDATRNDAVVLLRRLSERPDVYARVADEIKATLRDKKVVTMQVELPAVSISKVAPPIPTPAKAGRNLVTVTTIGVVAVLVLIGVWVLPGIMRAANVPDKRPTETATFEPQSVSGGPSTSTAAPTAAASSTPESSPTQFEFATMEITSSNDTNTFVSQNGIITAKLPAATWLARNITGLNIEAVALTSSTTSCNIDLRVGSTAVLFSAAGGSYTQAKSDLNKALQSKPLYTFNTKSRYGISGTEWTFEENGKTVMLWIGELSGVGIQVGRSCETTDTALLADKMESILQDVSIDIIRAAALIQTPTKAP